ncbi:hypothetical protein ZIOFF_004519 [Zingiber officinale]|uniref:SURP motif domain-containing protein n=3 Tax=Magnoliopsida TaxID=3398 RepID=A0A8J5I905_ZINOF|nr:hypothetical protein ZIOFF_004519 [Zingiber officinale]
MDLRLEGRHPLLFDDDAASAFINSADALVPWCGDPTLLIDRYDVRHLLDRIPPRPPRRASNRLAEEVADGGVTASQLDHERYLDLLPSTDDTDAISVASPDDAREISSDKIKDLDATYQAVPFSYGNAENAADPNKDSGLTYSGYRPAFPLPERLMSKLPDTEKLHQIIARTASFVSQHGGQSEIVLRVKQGDNPTFGFLMPDHHLHEYFRFLVDHPQLLNNDATSEKTQDKEKLEEQNKDMLPPRSGALSLLGSVYGSIEDDDDTNATGCTNPSIADNAPSSHSSEQALKTLEGHNKIKTTNSYVVPKDMTSTRKKLATRSMINFACRINGKEFEAILVEQDKSIRRGLNFMAKPPYYQGSGILGIHLCLSKRAQEFSSMIFEFLIRTRVFVFGANSLSFYQFELALIKGNARSKNKGRNEVSEAAHCRSSDMSEEWFYDPHRKEKFKMVIGGSKKEKHDQDSNRPTQSGASVDEAAAIVLAVTRGVSPANARQHVAAPDSTLGLSQREALLGSSAGSFSSLPDQDSMPKRGSSYEAGTSLHLSGLDPPSKRASRTVDDVWIAKAIAKTAALAASREADSSEASLTKEQKLKAERLKRARMFSAMIKSGNPLTTTCSAATDEDSSLHICAGTDIAHKEREGSSVPHDANDEDGNHKRHKSRQWSEHYSSSGRKHRKHHSSSDRVSRHHKHHSSSEDEYRHRKKSHHHKDEDASEDEENEKKLYDKHRNKHHSRSQRNHLIEREMNRNKLDQPEIAQKLSNQQQELNMPGSSDTKSTNASTEVSSVLDAYFRDVPFALPILVVTMWGRARYSPTRAVARMPDDDLLHLLRVDRTTLCLRSSAPPPQSSAGSGSKPPKGILSASAMASAARLDLDGNPIEPMTICMIGAGGFIGSHLCEKLMAETPHTVLAVDVYSDKIKHLLDAAEGQEAARRPWGGRIQFHRLNIKNDSRLEGLIKMSDLVSSLVLWNRSNPGSLLALFFSVICAVLQFFFTVTLLLSIFSLAVMTINLAAICTPADYNTRPLDTIFSNFIDALPVVKYCSENNKRVIHFSTCEVYGKTIGSFLPNDHPLRKEPEFFVLKEDVSPCIFGPIEKQRWSYACAKQLIERLIYAEGAENGLEFTIVRPFNWIGPRMDFIPGIDGPSEGVPRVLACFSNNLLRREPLKLVDGGQSQRTFVYIKDAIEAVLLMIENPARANGHIFNVGNPNNEVTVKQLAEIMTQVYSNVSGEPALEVPTIDVSSKDFYGEGYDDSDKRIPDMTIINKQLGWNPKTSLWDLLDSTLTYQHKTYAEAIRRSIAKPAASH